ncbi:hypothetical protein [Sphingobacterium sp. R2]|uniref:hypothetical protein n=1 Tax=Sphingobacterium sp. R2 TaxID=3112958 RepID=UPI00345DCD03
MATKLDPRELKQVITLHLDCDSNRKIGSALSIFRNTVNTYIHYLKELLGFDTGTLSELFSSHTMLSTARHNEL